MKKRIIGLVVVALLAIGGWQVYRYWDTTYHGVTAYAKVGASQKVASQNDDGSPYRINGKQVYTYEYKHVIWVTTGGQVRHVDFSSLEKTNPQRLAPGTYVKATISQKRVISGPNPVAVSALPAKVKAKLD